MAIDDVIVGFGANNTVLTFQPAAGVEIVITMVGALANINLALTDGTNISDLFVMATTAGQFPLGMKLGITNSVYIQLPAGGAGIYGSYSGIQTK